MLMAALSLFDASDALPLLNFEKCSVASFSCFKRSFLLHYCGFDR
jgi:hypothetical protein